MKFLLPAILFLFLFQTCKRQSINPDLLVKNVAIVDAEQDTLLVRRFVAIEGDKISGIYETEPQVGDSTKIVDATGQYLIPGLWDMHTHYNWNYTYASPLLIAHGITGIREMWGVMDTINHIRERSKAGSLLAPDIYSAGNIIDGTPAIWPGSAGVADAKAAIEEVDRQIEEKVDFFKVYSLLTKEAYLAIAEKSKEHNIPFAGHIPESVGIWEAMDAKQQSAEHLYGLLEACTSKPEELAEFTKADRFGPKRAKFLVETFDRTRFDSLSKVLASSETWLSPTLTVLRSISSLDDTTMRRDPRLEYMPAFIQQMWDPRNDFRFQSRGQEYYDAQRTKFRLQLSLIGDLARAGVKIIAGTDYPNPYCYPGFSLHDELQLLVEGGMAPAEALQAATINPAIFMGKENEIGKIASGYQASLVLLDGNPLDRISNTRKIKAVFLRGKYLGREALDALLEEAKEIAAKTGSSF